MRRYSTNNDNEFMARSFEIIYIIFAMNKITYFIQISHELCSWRHVIDFFMRIICSRTPPFELKSRLVSHFVARQNFYFFRIKVAY